MSVSEMVDLTKQGRTKSRYIELQIHGKLTSNDVESLTFRNGRPSGAQANTADKWKSKGVKVYYYDKTSDSVKEY